MTANPIQWIIGSEGATIASGASLSGGVNLLGNILTGIQMPAAWTAANLTFQASLDGTTYYDLYDSAGTEVTVTAGASQFIAFSATTWFPVRYLKVRSGTTGTPVNQGADREITLIIGDPTY